MINFVRYRQLCFLISVAVLSVGLYFYIYRGGFSYNIDFTGGTEVRLQFEDSFESSAIRHLADKNNWKDFVVQNLQSDKDFIIKIADANYDIEEVLTKSIKEAHPNVKFKIKSVDKVGPEAGKEVSWNAFSSILMVLLLLLLYISLRHQYAYAIGAVAALAHDLLVLLTFYLVFDVQVSLNILAGILSVLGYSLNDTIVVFSRIRGNLGLARNKSDEEIVNLSINQTLSRTLLTSFTTFISMFALFWFGGDVLRDFSITMLIAIVVGTYSSIYIASPVMMFFNKKGIL